MGTTTKKLLRQYVSERIGDYRSLTTSGSGSTTTVVDTSLKNYSETDDAFRGWYVLITSGSAAGEIRRVKGSSGYTASTGTLTVVLAFGASIGSSITYELHRYDPTEIHSSISQAIRDVYPILYRGFRDESIVVDNILGNTDLQLFASSTFTSWTHSVGTWTQETGIVRNGLQSAKGVASGANATLTQIVKPNVDSFTSQTAKAKRWVYATGANVARIQIDWGPSTSNSSYHSGADQWELLDLGSVEVPSNATQAQMICEVADGNTAYFGTGWLSFGSVYRYTIPSNIIQGPYTVEQQVEESNPNGSYAPIAGLKEGHTIRLHGTGYLTDPSSDSDATEVDGSQGELLVNKATMNLASALGSRTDDAIFDRAYTRAEQRYFDLIRITGVSMTPPSAQWSNGLFNVQTGAPVWTNASGSSAARYIDFSGARGTAVL